jgi:hypothetical protein
MRHGDHTDDQTSARLNSSVSSDIHRVEAQKFADAYADSEGRLRLISDPFGEWIEADTVMEVRP